MNKKNWYIHNEKHEVIYSGSEEEMSTAMQALTWSLKDLHKSYTNEEIMYMKTKYKYEGDSKKLKLVQV